MNATSDIREHMEVLGADGGHVGTVDSIDDGDRIKLTKSSSEDGHHHFIPVDWVDHVDQSVHLSVSAEEAVSEWEEGDLELDEDDAEVDEDTADEKEDDWAR